MAKTVFRFSFSELPLLIEDGFEAAMIEGQAEISYSRDGSWGISSISLNGYKRNQWTLADYAQAVTKTGELPPAFTHKQITLDVGTMLQSLIYHRLECEWRVLVQEAVAEQIAIDREAEADNLADMRREDRAARLIEGSVDALALVAFIGVAGMWSAILTGAA